jgi:putative ABC transport system permease protein
LLAIVVTCLGLLGLSSFLILRKTKEIGIRKVNGASVSQIIRMLNYSFIRWVSIAFVLATPISYYASDQWLRTFAYKTDLSWWVFALAGVTAVFIAMSTVSWQTWRAAKRNPVDALRYE